MAATVIQQMRFANKCHHCATICRFGKDHSTVISAVRKVEREREANPQVKRELEELEAKLGAF